MYIAAGQGQTTSGDKILMSTETFCHFGHLLQKISLKSDFIHFFSWFYTRIGANNPIGTKFWCQQEHLVILSLRSFVASFKEKSLLKSDFIHFFFFFFFFFFMILYMYIAPGKGQTAPIKFWCQQQCLVTSVICCKFQTKISFEVWFYTFFFFLWFYTCI